jgi:hypothetical protein
VGHIAPQKLQIKNGGSGQNSVSPLPAKLLLAI